MAQTVAFKRITFKNPYKRQASSIKRQIDKTPELEAVFIWRRARSLMKKAPRNPKTVHGEYKPYKQKTYERRVARYRKGEIKRPGRGFYRKGMYSAPGRPPFWHEGTENFNLRKMQFKPIKDPKLRHASTFGKSTSSGGIVGKGEVVAWRVGPKYKNSRFSTPVPALHEFGGQVRLNKKGRTYKDKRNPMIKMRREDASRAIYAPRPYMKPASIEARTSAARKSPQTLYRITNLGGMRGQRIY